jgi:hypothetical protein
LRELASLCLGSGCLAFWIVDPDQYTVTVLTTDGTSTPYTGNASIPLVAIPEALPVSEIFSSER